MGVKGGVEPRQLERDIPSRALNFECLLGTLSLQPSSSLQATVGWRATCLHLCGRRPRATWPCNFFKEGDPAGGSKVTLRNSFSKSLFVCPGSGLVHAPSLLGQGADERLLTIACPYAAEFILKALAPDTGKPRQPLLRAPPVTPACPSGAAPFISVR